jgi:hypothetical protein
MGPKELGRVLEKCVEHKEPVLIKGAPGVGKTDVVEQVSEKTGMDLIVLHPVVSDPTDFKGMPAIVEFNDKKRAVFLPFGELRKMMSAKKPTIVFLDDLGQAPNLVQAACMQLLLARQINGKKISDDIVFVAATNRRQDRAAVTGILEPVKSRFTTILEMQPEKDDWIEWALTHDMPEKIVGFVNFRPNLLMTEEATSEIVNHPSPRTIAAAGRLINMGLTSLEVLSGAVGQGCAVELVGFIKVFDELPNPQAILIDPDSVEVPKDPSALYAITAALVGLATKDSFGRVLRFGKRMPIEYTTLLVRDSLRKDGKLANNKAFIEWCSQHNDILI